MPVSVKDLTPLIQVFNMPRSLAFYRDVLGFEVVTDSGLGDDSSWVWIRLNGCSLMLNDQYEPGTAPDAPPSQRTKWHQDTAFFFGADPDDVYEHLKSKGLSPKPPLDTSYGMRQLSLSDPDGYNLCFQRSVESE